MRADKWLWAVRLFKTRALATEAIKKGRVHVNGRLIKPSFGIAIGQEIELRRGYFPTSYRVKALLKNRVGAKLVTSYYEETTDPEIIEQITIASKVRVGKRPKGEGRPTKKERRKLDDFLKDTD